MIIQNSSLFTEMNRQLESHASHKVSIARYGDTLSADWIGVECQDCRAVLLEFLPSSNHQIDPEHIRYEGHYDEIRDTCYIEVFKPGKAPYPLQERQDVINHSPTEIVTFRVIRLVSICPHRIWGHHLAARKDKKYIQWPTGWSQFDGRLDTRRMRCAIDPVVSVAYLSYLQDS